MRSASTDAEIRLWTLLLRNKKMMGYPFLRQRPVLNYIADFMCKELRLIIEVDGKIHFQQQEADRLRDIDLAAKGFNTLRFTNAMVMEQLDEVDRVIREWIKSRQGA